MTAPFRYVRCGVVLAIALVISAWFADAAGAKKCKNPSTDAKKQKTTPEAGNSANPKTVLTAVMKTTWDGQPFKKSPVTLRLRGRSDHLEIHFSAPFFQDPVPPCKAGAPCDLWKYEVIGILFLAEYNKVPIYTEIDLSPWGHYRALLLEGDEGKELAKGLLIEYNTITDVTRGGGSWWNGTAKIPLSHFPPNVEKWNAFAMHNSRMSPTGDGRAHWSLFPAPAGKHDKPNFFRKTYFEPIAFSDVLPACNASVTSKVWQKALAKSSTSQVASSLRGQGSTTVPTTEETDGTGTASTVTEETPATELDGSTSTMETTTDYQ